MTTTEINRRIAKLCYWHQTDTGWWLSKDGSHSSWGEPLNYCGSLDACREFETAFNPRGYLDVLDRLLSKLPSRVHPAMASPQLRAEAFLRYHGGWEE